MPIVNAGQIGLGALAHRCAASNTPLLIRGLLKLPQWESLQALGDRSTLLSEFGDEEVHLSLSSFLNERPESRSESLDGEKLSFMRERWGVSGGGSVFRRNLWQQVLASEPRPRTSLGDAVKAMRDDDLPPGAYIFHNVSGSHVLAEAAEPLHSLLRHVWAVQPPTGANPTSHRDTASAAILMRLGVGGSGSGVGFHDHELAINLAFAGRKRWLVARPGKQQVPASSPEELLHRVLPSAAFQRPWRMLGERGQTWDCTQTAGEMVFVPEHFLHATVNLDESLAVAVQCGDCSNRRLS